MTHAASKHAIVRIFDVVEHAEQARQALLAEGFGADAVQLDIASDEAAAVGARFGVGNGRPGRARGSAARNDGQARQHGHCVMMVAAADAAAAGSAAIILGRFGARDIDALTRQPLLPAGTKVGSWSRALQTPAG